MNKINFEKGDLVEMNVKNTYLITDIGSRGLVENIDTDGNVLVNFYKLNCKNPDSVMKEFNNSVQYWLEANHLKLIAKNYSRETILQMIDKEKEMKKEVTKK
jgi:hypothetical protein